MAVRKFEVPCVVRMKFLGTEVAQNRGGKVSELHAAASFHKRAAEAGSADRLWGPAPSPVEPGAPPPAPGP